MQLKGSHLTAAGILLACIVWIASGVITESSPAPQNDATKPQTADYLEVSIVTSQAQPVTAEIKLTGTTTAKRKVTIRSETSGRVVELLAERGQHMKAGEVIARLSEDDRSSRLAKSRSLLRQRNIEYQASKRLSSKAFASKIKLATSRAERDSAAAEYAAAKLDLERSRIKAPFDGILDTRAIDVGDYLGVNGTVATLVDLDPLEVEIQVSENRVRQVKQGTPVKLTMPDMTILDGVVTYVASAAEPATRTFQVRIELENPDLTYGDGMTVQVQLPLAQTTAHFISPAILTLSESGDVGVNAVDDKDTVVFYPVNLVREDNNGLWIRGLPSKVRLITVGQDYVKAGQKVSPKPDNFFQKPPGQSPSAQKSLTTETQQPQS